MMSFEWKSVGIFGPDSEDLDAFESKWMDLSHTSLKIVDKIVRKIREKLRAAYTNKSRKILDWGSSEVVWK